MLLLRSEAKKLAAAEFLVSYTYASWIKFGAPSRAPARLQRFLRVITETRLCKSSAALHYRRARIQKGWSSTKKRQIDGSPPRRHEWPTTELSRNTHKRRQRLPRHDSVCGTGRDVHEGPERHVVRSRMGRRDEGQDPGVPLCGGAFTPSTRLVSRNDGSGWSLFRF